MSATVATQEGRVQLEQSDMRLALNMAKMAKAGFSRAAIEETQFLIKKPRAEVQEVNLFYFLGLLVYLYWSVLVIHLMFPADHFKAHGNVPLYLWT